MTTRDSIIKSAELDSFGNPFVCCPHCGNHLSAAYDVPNYGRLTIDDSGVISAVEMSDDYDNGPNNYRIFCDDCGFYAVDPEDDGLRTFDDTPEWFSEISWD